MRRTVRVIVVTVLLSLVAAMSTAPRVPLTIPAPVAPALYGGPGVLAAHHIVLRTKFDASGCSSSAVGQHTLLTAGHCILGSGKIDVDGKSRNIVNMVFDEQDHALLLVDGAPFGEVARIAQRIPSPAEHVREYGFPGETKHVIGREGLFLTRDRNEEFFQLLVFPGDSGAGIVSDDGTIIAVVSTGNLQAAMTGAFSLAFTPAQLTQIR